MTHFKTIVRIIGSLLLLLALILLGCGGVAIYYKEEDLFAFLASALLCALFGLGFKIGGKQADNSFSRRDGYITVTVGWLVFTAFGALPYLISGYIPNYTNAFFESMSGFTTTGCTILDNIEALPHGLLFWRSLTQWLGGLGIVFFTIAILPIFGVGNVQLFAAESTGPTHQKSHPRVSVTAHWVFTVYIAITVACTVCLLMCNMGLFDAICHSLCTASTGGFSTRQASIEAFHSPAIEYVLAFFMFISGINFTLLYYFVLKGKIRRLFTNTEFRWYFGIVCLFTLTIALGLFAKGSHSLEGSFREALFQVISIQTTTGFASTDYMHWPPYLWMLLSFTMYIGACGGSSTGAIKCSRMAILLKSVRNEFNRIIHPNAVLPIRMDQGVISPTTRTTVLTFTCMYILLVFAGWFVFMILGIPFMEAYSMTVSSLGNIGPALGELGPAYSWDSLPDSAKWLSSLLMLVGRLELFSVLLLFAPGFWKKR